MSDVKWEEIEPILDRVLELPEKERLSFVNESCAGNRQLKTEVIALLKSITDSEGWLENPDSL